MLKPQDSGNFGMFISKGYSGDGSFTLARFNSSSVIRFYIDNVNITTDVDTYDKWLILTVELDRENHQIKLFRNSNLEYTKDVTNDLLGDNSYEWTIGRDASSSNYTYKGYISDIIYLKNNANNDDRLYIENNLRYKYAPPVNLGENIHIPYGFCDTTIDAGKRFTNYLWNTGDTTQTISTNHSGIYSVTVTDIFGFESFDSITITFPQVTQLQDTTICFGDTICWNTGLKDTNYTFLWQNNSTDSLLNIYSEGDYYVQITDTNNCKYQSDTIHISIDNYPITTSLGNDDTLCAHQNLYLKTGDEETLNYLWNTGSTESFIRIDTSGEYSVIANNTRGCIAKDSIQITVKGVAPDVGFYEEKTCLKDHTVFTDTSNVEGGSKIISWYWNFGNNDTSDLQNPNIQYTDTGNYKVTLQVTTDSACTSKIERIIRINPLPKAQFSHTQLCNKQNIKFISESNSPNGNITNTLWTFSDGTSYTNKIVNKKFDKSENIQIQLKIEDDKSCKDSISSELFIKASPITNFSHTALCKDKESSFFDLSSAESSSIIAWYWNFGDGSNSYLENPTHKYSDTGDVSIYLSTQAVNGCTDTLFKNEHIYNNPIAQFNITDACQNSPIGINEFSVDSNSTIQKYIWFINDKLISQFKTPDYSISKIGNYQILLKIISQSGCVDTLSHYFSVRNTPLADFSISSYYTTPYTTLYFKPDSTLENTSYQYNFGDQSQSEIANTQHYYKKAGKYTVSLNTKNNWGCTDSAKNTVKIINPMLNLSLSDLTIKEKDEQITTSLLLHNIGNLDIDKIQLRIEIGKQYAFDEMLDISLKIGETKTYELKSRYLTKKDQAFYMCVKGTAISPYTDIDESNNTVCVESNTSSPILKIYPKPSEKEITIVYKALQNQDVEVDIIDLSGKIIKKTTIPVISDVHKYYFDISNLAKGKYKIRIVSKENTAVEEFIKL